MHILIANDDGIFAPGIRALAKAAVAAGHRVTVFAPDSQRSAASHAITLGAARQYGESHRKGSIAPGKAADLVILDRDPLVLDENPCGAAADLLGKIPDDLLLGFQDLLTGH